MVLTCYFPCHLYFYIRNQNLKEKTQTYLLENQKNLSENLRQNLVLLDLKELLITTLSRHEAMLILLVRTTNICASYLQLLQRTTALDDLRICLDHTHLMSAC